MFLNRALRVVAGLVLMSFVVLYLAGAITLLSKLAPGWPSPWGDIALMSAFLLNLVLTITAFIAVPAALLGYALRIDARRFYLLAGAVGGVLALFASYAQYRLAASPTQVVGYVERLTTGLPALASDFLHATNGSTLFFDALFGAGICGYGWLGVIRYVRQLRAIGAKGIPILF
jgi:hypothetical protein